MIIVAGEVQIAHGSFDLLKPAMDEMLNASRSEPGCITYTYARDVSDPTRIRVFEQWDSEDALNTHLQSDHTKIWRTALAEAKILSRNLSLYRVSGTKKV